MIRACAHCQGIFQATRQNINRGTGGWSRFCSASCFHTWKNSRPSRAQVITCRRLRNDEQVPGFAPRRFRTQDGYILLRWYRGNGEYVEALEHRIVAGRQMPHVHHINGDHTDNRPDNLRPMTASAHLMEHATIAYTEAAALYADGWSLPRLAKRYGIGNVTIMRGLKRRGIKMRTIAEAWVIRKQAKS